MYRPARLRNVVSAAPLLPRSSLSTWTRNCWPGVMRSAMLGRRPSASAWSALSGFVNSSREISLAGRNPWPVGAELDEGGSEARFYAGDLGLVDVAFLLLPPVTLDVEVIEALAVHEGDADLFGLRRVDEHAFHSAVIPWLRRETRSSPKASSEASVGLGAVPGFGAAGRFPDAGSQAGVGLPGGTPGRALPVQGRGALPLGAAPAAKKLVGMRVGRLPGVRGPEAGGTNFSAFARRTAPVGRARMRRTALAPSAMIERGCCRPIVVSNSKCGSQIPRWAAARAACCRSCRLCVASI